MHRQTYWTVYKDISPRDKTSWEICVDSFMKGSTCICCITYKVFATGYIPITNVLVKRICETEHRALYVQNVKIAEQW